MPLGLGQVITSSDISANVAAEGSGSRVSYSNTYSADLDGVNDRIRFATAYFWQNLFGANDFSLSYWIKHADVFKTGDSNPTNGIVNTLGFNTSSQLENIQMGIVYGPDHSSPSYRNRMNFNCLDNQDFSNPPFNTFSTDLSSILSDDTWYHVVYTSEAGASSRTGKIYINGVDRTGTDTSGAVDLSGIAPVTSAGGDGIGVRVSVASDAEFTELNVDEISAYNVVLSASDVTAVYNSGVPTDESSRSGLIGYWRFGDGDDRTGTAILDQSSNSNNFQLSGATFAEDVPS